MGAAASSCVSVAQAGAGALSVELSPAGAGVVDGGGRRPVGLHQVVARAVDAGVFGYLVKPFWPGQLLIECSRAQ